VDPSPIAALWGGVPAFTLVLARLGALFVAAPILGGALVPSRVKVLLSAAVALILVPQIAANAQPIPADGRFIILLVQEVMVGLSIGFMLTIYAAGVRAGGELINRFAGFTAAENFDPETEIGEGPMGDLLNIALILLFLAADGHHLVITALARSYDAVPFGAWRMTPEFLQASAHATGQLMAISLALAFPVLAATMLVTVAEGFLSRAVPQINVMHLSFASKILVSILVMWAGLPAAVAFIGTVVHGMQQAVGTTLPLLG
jgi:flagellar biosynthetic protein FliR